jgi:hypothetical protein
MTRQRRARIVAAVAGIVGASALLGAVAPPAAFAAEQAKPAAAAPAPWVARMPRGTTQPFKDPNGRFGFEVPRKDWLVVPGGGPIFVAIISKKGDAALFVERALLKQPLAPEDITELFAELEIELVKERVPNATDFQTQVIEVDGRKLVAVQYLRQGVTGPERVRQYSIPAGQHLFRLSCVASVGSFAAADRVFAHAAATFTMSPAPE